MAHIVVVEDEVDLQAVLQYNLEQAGYETSVAGNGAQALAAIRARKPDLVILDLMLPDTSGTEICRVVRAEPRLKSVPIIMLTAKGEEMDRVVGFEVGADDYVVKPFSVRELLLRISALLKRTSKSDTETTPGGKETFGCLRIDAGAHRVWVQNKEIELSALEFRLLTTLYARRNRVQTRGVLLDDVWGLHADTTTRTVDTHVKRLREKLGEARHYVETVRGVGYRFVESVEGSTP